MRNIMMPIDQSTPLWIASRMLIAERKSDLLRIWKLSLKTFDAEDIHDLRVSSRRMREALNLFSPCFLPKAVSKTSKTIRRLTRLLGSMRNTDEALQFFRSMNSTCSGEHLQEIETIAGQLELERNQERDILKQEMQRISPSTVRAELDHLLANPLIFCNSRTDPFMEIAAYGKDRIGERSEAIKMLIEPSLDESNISAQHRLRIAVKRLRYRYEILSPLCGREYAHLHTTVKSYQDLLGEMHDLDVFAQMIAERIPDMYHRTVLLEETARKRHERYSEFSYLMEDNPLDTLGDRMRRSL